jgi:hypothetical protein
VRLFGEDVVGSTSVVDLRIGSQEPTPVAITEWVVEAGERIWIVRASQELGSDSAEQTALLQCRQALSTMELKSDDLHQPSTSLRATQRPVPREALDTTGLLGSSSDGPDLPFPSWWSGECDINNYLVVTGQPSYPLGAEYRGMKACGPRPWADGGPEVWVNFGAGVSQIEWQCPELSKRFLYLAYGIPPYSANGSQVVWAYTGDLLDQVANCEPGRAPEPDDVLSYGSTSTYGHTSVVMASDVDSSGNGTIEVIEQNSSLSGSSTLNVANWCVLAYSAVSGWLHNDGGEPPAIWLVDIFSDDHLGTVCSSAYQEGDYVFGNWGSAAPASGCPSDHFSARFSRVVGFAGGEYTFGLGYDSAGRLKVGGETVIDGWGTADQHYETHLIEAGSHEVVVEYQEDLGDAQLTAFWWGPGFDLGRESQDNTQWYAQYWGNQTLWWDPIVMVNEGTGFLDHHWFDHRPLDGLPEDHFGARFERTVHFDAGPWRFHVSSDDGVRFWIDGELIIDEWQDQVAAFVEDVELGEGDHALRVEHYENDGWAVIRLRWDWMGPRPWKMFLPTLLACRL